VNRTKEIIKSSYIIIGRRKWQRKSMNDTTKINYATRNKRRKGRCASAPDFQTFSVPNFRGGGVPKLKRHYLSALP